MATIEDLFAALKEADKAGDVEGATKLAQYISNLGYGPQIEPEKPAPKVGVTDYLKDIPKAVGRGAVGLLETAGIGAAAALPEEYETKAREFITGAATPAKEYLAPATPEIGESIPSKLFAGVGSTAPFFALGPLGLAGRLAATGLGTAAGAGEARTGAELAGATPEERAKATALGAPTGLLDLIAPNIGPLKNLLTTALARGGVEGLTEAAQKVAQNMIAKGIYNPEQDVLAGSGEEGAYGAGVGALTSLLVDLTLGRRAKGPKAGEQPAAPPVSEAPAVPEVPSAVPPAVPPTAGGFSAEDAARLRQEAEQAEVARQEAIAERERLAEEERQQAMATTQERMAGVPGMAGMPGANEAMMGQVRRRQAEEAAAEQARQQAEVQRQRDEQLAQEDELRSQIDKINNTTFSADPVQNQIAKDRALGQLRSELGSMTAARIRAEQAEPPKYEPITAPQEAPKGAKVTKFTPEEEAEIEGLKSNLSEVNKEIAKAKKEKTSLFNRLKGELIYRPGSFGIKDIDSDNKALGALFNKKGQGVLLEDLVADGSLDEFLPARNRALIGGVQNPNFDASAAVEHIADKLRTRQYGSTAESETLGRLTEEKDRIQQEIDRLQTVPEVNLDLARRAGVPKAEEEQISLPDLEADAQMKGVDTEALKQRVATANPDATPEQFLGFYRGALGAATSTSPSYDIGGYEYTAEELETSIAERLTDEEIDEYIAQAEAEQAATARVAKKPAPRSKAEPAPKREAEEEPLTPEPTAEPEDIKIPGARQSVALGDAVVDNDWDRITDELQKSKNPIIANIGRMSKDLVGVFTEINPRVVRASNPRALAGWSPSTNGIYFKNKTAASSEHVVAHEATHALTYYAVKNPRPDQKAAVKRLDNLYRFVKTKLKAEGKGKLYGLKNMDEFLAEANGNPDFQKELARIPYQKQTAWGAFTQAVADILGIKNSSALTEVLALTEELTTPASRKTVAKPPVQEKKPTTQAKPPTEAKPEKPPVLTAPPGFKLKKGRNEQVVLAAQELDAGRITKEEYDRYVDYYMEIAPVPSPEPPLNEAGMKRVLKSNQVEKINPSIANNTPVGLRMDINALEKAKLLREKTGENVNGSVVAIHPKNNPRSPIGYSGSAYVTNAKFAPRNEAEAMQVAMNLKDKSPQQTIEGRWVNKSNDEIYRMVQEHLNDPSWAQVNFDPLRHSFFFDRTTRQPILSADEVLQVGRFVLAKNPVYGKREDFLYMEGKGTAPDTPAFKKWFGDSKVVDENGEPLVVYHGTTKDFDVFKSDAYRGQSFFTDSPNVAGTYAKDKGGSVYPVYLKINKPFEHDFDGKSWDKIRRKDLPFKVSSKLIDANAQSGYGPNAEFSLQAVAAAAQDAGYDGLIARNVRDSLDVSGGQETSTVYVVNGDTQIKSAIGNRGTYSETEPSIIALELSPTARDALEILEGQGRTVKAPEPGYIEKTKQSWDNAVQNPKLTREQAISTFRKWLDQFETWAFSSDAGLNNQIRKAIIESTLGQEEKIGRLLNASLSQTVHSDAVANLFLTKGDIKWDDVIKKWVGVDSDNNILKLSKQMDAIADKHGMTKEQIELIAHTAFEAKRTQSLIRENANIVARAEAMRAEAARIRADSPVAASELLEKANRLEKTQKIIHLVDQDGNIDYEAIKAGMTQFELFPELNDVVKTWDGIRSNALKVMVDTGLYSQEEAENLMANADYVPFFREDQIEQGKGPKEFLRSLSVQADKRMKGSRKPVNDIFDNMVRWTQYAVNRGVRNRSALALVDAAGSVGLGEKVSGPKDGENVVRVWRNGQEEYHSMADPMFVSAFQGLESVSIPTVKFFSKFADVLRNSVVLFPLFSVSQVTQDSFAAMFSSGLKPQFALSIPFRAAKEFLQTLRGKSSIHEELKNVGVVGVRDFTSSIIRSEVEVLSGLKKDKSFWDKVKRQLGNFAMAADNAVRQATYEAALAQGMSRAEAIEKAFEIFNVRRRGSSQMLAMAGQVIPFFNAYLAAQNVAYRTLTGVGTSPTERKAALQTLAATTASVMALSMLYAMMMGDDEGYEKKPTPTRDRLLMIPGTNGLGIPLRADAFVLPKVLAEHTYHLITENGMTDPAKFRASLASLLANSILSPTPVPQAVKPLAEAILNYDFFQQQPLVGIYQAKKDKSRQFEDSTSEFAKVLGQTELISPIVADHLIRGMFGSFGGLFLMTTNPLIAAMAGTTRPDMSLQDAANAIPNASAFVSKEYEVGLRKDFYALKDITDRAANTLSDLKNRSPQEIEEYLSDEKVRQRLALSPVVNRIANQLTTIRKQVNMITNIEDPKFTSERKEEEIRKLREMEYQLLKNIDLRKLREMAQM
jgi:hypothetical protein